MFPVTDNTNWCGEWAAKPVADLLAGESDRNQKIWAWYRDGLPLDAIRLKARELKGCKQITKERVRQIINRIKRQYTEAAPLT
jgi:hypothetical protein